MLDTRAQQWLSRLQGNGPRLVSLGLAALIAVELARIAITLLGGGPVKSPQPELSTIAPHAAPHAGLDLQSGVPPHRSGTAVPAPSPQAPPTPPRRPPNWGLPGRLQPRTRSGASPLSAM